ncbi:MAG: PQQ-like beta-propeller repeat protein [Ignavibacteriales bacterium]|nr:PQQ-like beta-propeller repeat protein [Ignavibacteriales bacterium]
MTAIKLLFKNTRPLKYFIFSLTCVVFAAILTSCEQNPTAPNEPPKPPGYQEDIYWPSLADSPWPMNHHDPQNTGRSKISGFIVGNILAELEEYFIQTGISVSPDSSFYLVTSYPSVIRSFTKEGIEKWNIQLGDYESFVTPAISARGYIYSIAAQEGLLYQIDLTGKIKWIYQDPYPIWQSGISIGLDETIYFVNSNNELKAIDLYGNLIWSVSNQKFGTSTQSFTVFSPDGKTLYIPGENTVSLVAFDIISQQIKWEVGQTPLLAPPVINSGGDAYIFCSIEDINESRPSLFCISEKGEIHWDYDYQKDHSIPIINNSGGALDRYGNFYFAEDTLYKVDYNGNQKWKKSLDVTNWTPIIVDVNDNIFVTTINKIYKFDQSGNQITTTDLNTITGGSPAISYGGKVLIPSWKSKEIFIIN